MVRVPAILAPRRQRREKRERELDLGEEIEEEDGQEEPERREREGEDRLRKISTSTTNLNLTLSPALVAEEDAPSTPPTPPTPPVQAPSRRRSFMHTISTGQRDSLPQLPQLQSSLTRQSTGFRGRLSRNSTSSIGGAPPPSPVPEFLGLNLVYTPPADSGPLAGDIIFVHGLGGSPFETWSWMRDRANFWPVWLPDDDPALARFRIHTFGYNSNFRGESTNLEIIDFAKDLLMQMLTFQGGAIGADRPVFFVAHSMGGLVVKKAILLGAHDRKYGPLVERIAAIVFLATPHRGAQYAQMLNKILAAAGIGSGAKPYVAELERQSTMIQDINENFRQYCHRLSLASFYETLKTSFGLTKVTLVDKESAVLGYSNEMSASMDADHHTICKFRTRADVNYLKLRGILRKWAEEMPEFSPLQVTGSELSTMSPTDTFRGTDGDSPGGGGGGDWRKSICTILGISEHTELDLGTIRASLSPGSGSWLLQRADYRAWLRGEAPSQPGAAQTVAQTRTHMQTPAQTPVPASRAEGCQPLYYWLLGLPGNGKTSLAACVIGGLREQGESVQYHFFSDGNQRKKTIAYCLRSLAAQLALSHEGFGAALLAFGSETGITFSGQPQSQAQAQQAFHVIWDKLFESIIFPLDFGVRAPVWVIDGIDEADTPGALLTCLSRIRSLSPIRIFLTSRPSKGLSLFPARRLTSYFLQEADTHDDIRSYAVGAVRTALPEDPARQTPIVDEILRQASGNFLWVKLALDSLQESWHTEEDIRMILTEAPRGMVSMYTRMLASIQAQGQQRNRALARRILTWAACGWRPLSIAELEAALSPEFSGFTNLESTVAQICGNFITISRSNPLKPRVNLIHGTARDFLLRGDGDEVEAFVRPSEAHQHIAFVCLSYLSSEKWRRIFGNVQASVKRTAAAQAAQPAQTQTAAEPGERTRENHLVKIGQDHAFLTYATSYWAYHVWKSPAGSGMIAQALGVFFSRFCLSWVEAIALSGNLHALTTTAQYLKAYANRCEKRRQRQQEQERERLAHAAASSDADADAQQQQQQQKQQQKKATKKTRTSPLSIGRVDEEVEPEAEGVDGEDVSNMIRGWSNDFIRLGAKFSPSLIYDPSSIYRQIPPFCPKESMLWKTYGTGACRPGSAGGGGGGQLTRQSTFNPTASASSSTTSSSASLALPRPFHQQLAITGLPSENWDDCLASVSVGRNDDHITQALASESHFFGLVSSAGTMTVWGANTCEHIRTIRQGEYVRFMALGRGGTLLGTAGFQSFCVWEVCTGRLLHRLGRNSCTNAAAVVLLLAFGGRDSELIVGLDDGTVRWLDLATGRASRTFTARVTADGGAGAGRSRQRFGCPTLMALSPDHRYVAMGWRGHRPMVWDLTAPPSTPPIRCAATATVPEHRRDSIDAPEQLLWRPDAGSLLVRCQNTTLAEWKVAGDEDELTEFRHIECWLMSVSADGRFLITNDTSKTISIWAFPGLNLAYRLLNVDDLVSDLTLSPSGQRFYDARGAMCNVWEPDALVPTTDEYGDDERFSDEEGSRASGGPATPPPLCEPVISRSHAGGGGDGAGGRGRRSVVTAVALDAAGRYFCAGREDGSVQIHAAASGTRLRRVYGGHGGAASAAHAAAAVLSLAWSPSGRYIVSCDESSRVVAKRLQPRDEAEQPQHHQLQHQHQHQLQPQNNDSWAVFPVLDCRIGEPAQQFIFSPAETHLLISTPSTDQVWDLRSKRLIHVRRWAERQHRRWLQHPADPSALLWIDPAMVRSHAWPSLAPVLTATAAAAAAAAARHRSHPHHSHRHDGMDKNGGDDGGNGRSLPPAVSLALLGSRFGDGSGPPGGNGGRRASCEPVWPKVTWVGAAVDGRTVVYATVPDDGRLWLSDMTLVAMHPLPEECGGGWRKRILPRLADRVKLLVGMYGKNLVFLDRDSWLCTWDASPLPSRYRGGGEGGCEPLGTVVEAEDGLVTRHFFIPKDWLVTHTVPIPRINSQGTFFYPKYGDVAVVWNGVKLAG